MVPKALISGLMSTDSVGPTYGEELERLKVSLKQIVTANTTTLSILSKCNELAGKTLL